MQIPIHRNVWGLGPSKTGYPGAFPRGFINKVKRKWWGKKRLWLFSGGFVDPDGIMVDIKEEVGPTIVADCEFLPFKDESFDFVLLDPPYSSQESEDMYGLPYFNIIRVCNEAARILEEGGHLLILHRLAIFYHPNFNIHWKRLQLEAVVGVYIIAGMSNMRALTVYRKKNTLKNLISEQNLNGD